MRKVPARPPQSEPESASDPVAGVPSAASRHRNAASLLERAETHMRSRRNRAVNDTRAETLVRECLLWQIPDAQMLRAHRLMARVCDDRGESEEAIAWATSAIRLAEALGDRQALVELLRVRGKHYYYGLRLGLAADDYRRCLVLIRDLRAGPEDRESLAAELAVLAKLAGWEYLMGYARKVQRLLSQARAVRVQVPECVLDGILIDYTQALLAMWRGKPEWALKPATAAAEAYTKARVWNSASRLHVQSAIACLDMAAGFESAADRRAHVRMACQHHRKAVVLARRANDANALALATLVEVRINRALGRADDWEHVLGELIARAREQGDTALLAQALTAKGNAYAAQGDERRALAAYNRVLKALDGSELYALGIDAHRALKRYDERHVDMMLDDDDASEDKDVPVADGAADLDE